MKMGRCIAYGCKNDSEKKDKGISFHRFPTNKQMRKKWIENLYLEDWMVTVHSRLCGKHFEKRFFYKTNQKTRLLRKAKPTIHIKKPKYIEYNRRLEKMQTEVNQNMTNGNNTCFSDDEINNSMSDMESENFPGSEERLDFLTIIDDDDDDDNDNDEATLPSDGEEFTKDEPIFINVEEEGVQHDDKLILKERSPQLSLNGDSALIENSDDEVSSLMEFSDENLPFTSESELDDKKKETSRTRKRPLPRSLRECSFDDMDSPLRARRCWTIATKTICDLRAKVKALQRQKGFVKRKAQCLNALFQYLEENNFLNDYASAVVKAVMPGVSQARASS